MTAANKQIDGPQGEDRRAWRELIEPLVQSVDFGLAEAGNEGLPQNEGLTNRVLWGCYERLGYGATTNNWRSMASGDAIDFAIRRVQWKELAWVVACEEPDPRNTPDQPHSGSAAHSINYSTADSHAALETYLDLHQGHVLASLKRRPHLQYSHEDRYQSSLSDFYHAYLRSGSACRFGTLSSMWHFIEKQAIRVDDPRMEPSARNRSLHKLAPGQTESRGLQSLTNELIQVVEAGDADVEAVAARLYSEEVQNLLVELLPTRTGTILVMLYYRGMKQKDIAQDLGISPPAVNQRLNQGIQLLTESERFLTALGL